MTQVGTSSEKSGPDWNLSHKESLNANGMRPDLEETLREIDEDLGVIPVAKDAVSKSVKG